MNTEETMDMNNEPQQLADVAAREEAHEQVTKSGEVLAIEAQIEESRTKAASKIEELREEARREITRLEAQRQKAREDLKAAGEKDIATVVEAGAKEQDRIKAAIKALGTKKGSKGMTEEQVEKAKKKLEKERIRVDRENNEEIERTADRAAKKLAKREREISDDLDRVRRACERSVNTQQNACERFVEGMMQRLVRLGIKAKKQEDKLAAAEAAVAAYNDAMRERAERFAKKDLKPWEQAVAPRYVYVKYSNRYFDLVLRKPFDAQTVDRTHKHEMPMDENGRAVILPTEVFDMLPAHIAKRVAGAEYNPGEGLFFQDKERVGNPEFVNLYVNSRAKPVKGDVSKLFEHLRYMCSGNEDEVSHILQFLAYIVQRPGKKIRHVLMLISEGEGTGKDTIGNIMRRILGIDNVQTITQSSLLSDHQKWLETTEFGIVSEVKLENDASYNRVKELITNDFVQVNPKHVDPYNVRNLMNFLFISNHLDAIPLTKGDRRFCIIHLRADPKNTAYYDAFYNWLDNEGGKEAIAYFLQNDVSLKDFNPHGRAPMTEGKDRAFEAGRGTKMTWLRDQIGSRKEIFARDIVQASDIIKAGRDFGVRIDTAFLHNVLPQLGGGYLSEGGKKFRVGPETIYAWALRHFEFYRTAVPGTIANAYQGLPVGRADIDNPEWDEPKVREVLSDADREALAKEIEATKDDKKLSHRYEAARFKFEYAA